MVVCSKLAVAYRNADRLLGPLATSLPSVRHSHAALFRKRPGQLIVNRIKVTDSIIHGIFVDLRMYPISTSSESDFCQFYSSPPIHISYSELAN